MRNEVNALDQIKKKSVIDRFFTAMDTLLTAMIFVLAVMMLFCGLYQVIGRYVLKISTPWTEELLRYLYVVLTYGACGLCVKKGAYISISVVSDRIAAIGRTEKIVIQTIITVFQMVFFILMAVFGWQMAMSNMTAYSTANQICMGWVYMVFPFGGVTGMLYTLNGYRLMLQERREGDET